VRSASAQVVLAGTSASQFNDMGPSAKIEYLRLLECHLHQSWLQTRDPQTEAEIRKIGAEICELRKHAGAEPQEREFNVNGNRQSADGTGVNLQAAETNDDLEKDREDPQAWLDPSYTAPASP
jgi:hypothetical protein